MHWALILAVASLGSMKDLQAQIRNMYAEIVNYGGRFGDSIDHGSYNPYDMIRDPELTSFERTGVSIAILHFLDCAIENTTYKSALADQGPLIRAALADGLLDFQPLVRSAAEAFFESEPSFLLALNDVFERLVRPEVPDPHAH